MGASLEPPEAPFPLPNTRRREDRLIVRRCPAVPQCTIQPPSCCAFEASHESSSTTAGFLLRAGIFRPVGTPLAFGVYLCRRPPLPAAQRPSRYRRCCQPLHLVLRAVANLRGPLILSRWGRTEEAFNQASPRSCGPRSPPMCSRFLPKLGHVPPRQGERGFLPFLHLLLSTGRPTPGHLHRGR